MCRQSFIEINDAEKTLIPITAHFVETDEPGVSGRIKGVYRTSALRPWIVNFLLSDRAKVQVHLNHDAGPTRMSGEFKVKNFTVFHGRDDINAYLCDIASVGAIDYHA